MYKRKDSDIFGTCNVGFAPRIENYSFVDPHAAFKKKSEQNYEKYQAGLSSVPQVITGRPLDSTKVNQNVSFEENYHKNRKQIDMQSSIFYPPTARTTNQNRQRQTENNPLISNKLPQEINYGRKQIFKRQINQLPLNTAQIRGNSSRLFDLDERIKYKSEQVIPLIPLIPHQMKWDQHDSIKYSHINYNNNNNQNHQKEECPEINNISQSKSQIFQKKQTKKNQSQLKTKSNELVEKTNIKQLGKAEIGKQSKVQNVGISIKIMKGWNHKFMEGLSKHCKLNNSAILSFEAEQQSKVSLTIKKSQRWENVIDWLRKDCKLKIRVMN